MKIDTNILLAVGAIVGFFGSLMLPDGNIIVWCLGGIIGAAIGLGLGLILKRGRPD